MNPTNILLPKARVFSGVVTSHSFVFSRDGSVNAIGLNGHGQLGLGDREQRPGPSRQKFFSRRGSALKKVACGKYHSLFMTTCGEIFSCGSNSYGQLGLGDTSVRKSIEEVKSLSDECIVDISCGENSSFCLSLDGVLFSCGGNEYGQLGDGTYSKSLIYTKVNFPNDEKIVLMSSGKCHVAAITESGDIYTYGANEYGQLGRKGSPVVPMKVKRLPVDLGRPVQVFCGAYHTTIAYSSNQIYSFGCNGSGQLGIGNITNQQYPVRVDWFKNNPIKVMSVGGAHTVCILESGTVVAFGYNRYHQLCLGDGTYRVKPTKMVIDDNSETNNDFFIDVVCGDFHTLLLTEGGSCYGVGNKVAFSRDEDISEPILLLGNVDLGKREWIGGLLMQYILEEQNLSEDVGITTDLSLNLVSENGSSRNIRLNRSFMEVRCVGNYEAKDIQLKDITDDTVQSILKYLYGGIAENVKKASELRSLLAVNMISLADCLNALYERKEEDGDVKIVSKNDSHDAHRFILIARTQYFRSIFRGLFKESLVGIVELDMPLGRSFEIYLLYLYTGTIGMMDSRIAAQILEYVDYFGGGGEEYGDSVLLRYCRKQLSR